VKLRRKRVTRPVFSVKCKWGRDLKEVTTMAEGNTCPKCGAELAADAPGGICPQCLLGAGLGGSEIGAPGPQAAAPSWSTPGFRPPTPEELAPHFPHLEILELLGKGGMGAVYKARQPSLGRLVAVKVLPPEVGADASFSERFTREARALAKLNHQNIVAVHDFGRTDDLYYFIMEYVDGATLRQLVDAGRLQPAEALAIVPQICDALQFAHDEGVVHRDIKPDNILLDGKGRVKIADFGLAKLLDLAAADASLTGTHQVMGTPHYMAPEQMQGSHDVDHRADIYSLGVVFYEMLTGQLPIGRFELPSKKVQVDVRLDDVVLRSLQAEPDRRYQHVSEIGSAVKSLEGPEAASVVEESSQGRPATEWFRVNLLIMGTTIPLVWFAMWWAESEWPLLGFCLPMLLLGAATEDDPTPRIWVQALACFLCMIGTIAFSIWRSEEAWMLGVLLPVFVAWCMGCGAGDEIKKKRRKEQAKRQDSMNESRGS
jgi:serine/threonine protein kinase